jgi:ABC-type glycerol-3-phosphate transport system substrate-binding protein
MQNMVKKVYRSTFAALAVVALLSAILGACATPTPEVIQQTVVVQQTVPVQQTVVVQQTVPVPQLITPTLGAQTYRAYTYNGKKYPDGTTVVYMGGMSVDQQRALEEDAVWFKQATNIDLQFQLGDDAKFNALVAAGTPPDLYYCSTPGLQAADGTFAPIDQYVDKDFMARVPQAFIDGYTGLDGKLYGLQLGGWFPVVLINTKLLKDAGVAVPSTDWTWDDVVAIGQKVTKDANGKGPTDAAFDPKKAAVWGFWAGWFADDITAFSNGAARMDPTHTRYLSNDPKFIEAWKWWADLSTTYKVMPTNDWMGTNGTSASQLFMAGKLAMYAEGFDFSLFSQANDKVGAGNWKLVAYPHPKTHDLVLSRYPGGACMTAKSKNPAATVQALEFLSASGYIWYPNLWLKDSNVVSYWTQFYPFLKDVNFADTMTYSLAHIGPEPWNGSAAPFNVDRYTQSWDFWNKWNDVRNGKLAFDKFDFAGYVKQANTAVIAGMTKDLQQVNLQPAWKDALQKLLDAVKAAQTS